jgi:hypothetical protein
MGTSAAITCAVFVVISAQTAQAGINAWTSIGPEGGNIGALAIDPTTPTALYAGTNGAASSRVPARARPGVRRTQD